MVIFETSSFIRGKLNYQSTDMTKTNSIASKLFVGFVATAMLFTLSYTPAKAATAAELQAQIDALLAQIAGMTTGGSSSSCAQFTMDLTIGASGAEVTALQNFLIGKGHAIAAGATGYFGGQTQAALSAFQSANGISPAAGYFGPVTRAKVNGMCTTTGGGNNGGEGNNGGSNEELSGEASLDDVTAKDGDDTDLEEGQDDAPVADFQVEFTDGDAKISRIDLGLVRTSANPGEDPWDTFEDVSLWVDGDEVARVDANDEDEYLDEDDGTLRFSGLDIVAKEGEKLTVTVGVTVQGSVDDMPATWRVDMESLRFFDGEDVATTEDGIGDMGTGNGVSFDIGEEGGDDELIVKSSTEDPDATTLALQDNEKSDWLTVFAFDLDTDDSTNDITVNDLPVALTFSSSTNSTFVNDVQLVVDGETYDDFTMSADAATRSYIFDTDGDLVIDAGDRVTVEVQVEFKALALGNEGVTASGTASSTHIDAEGSDDLVGSQLSGSATGEAHTLRTEGAVIEINSTSQSLDSKTDATTADDEGVFTIKFDVTAFESDLWVNKSAASSTSMGTNGVNFRIENSVGAAVSDPLITAALSSTADTDGTRFIVREGETETFTLTTNYNPSATGFYQAQLYSLNFATTNADPTTQQRALPESDFETDQINISN